MQNAIILNTSDIKKILSEKYNCSEEDIITTKYSYVIKVTDGENTPDKTDNS